MRFFKTMKGWTEGHHVLILFILLVCVSVLLVSLVAHRNGKIELLEKQLEDSYLETDTMRILYEGMIDQAVELQTQLENKDAEIKTLQDAINRIIGAQ